MLFYKCIIFFCHHRLWFWHAEIFSALTYLPAWHYHSQNYLQSSDLVRRWENGRHIGYSITASKIFHSIPLLKENFNAKMTALSLFTHKDFLLMGCISQNHCKPKALGVLSFFMRKLVYTHSRAHSLTKHTSFDTYA